MTAVATRAALVGVGLIDAVISELVKITTLRGLWLTWLSGIVSAPLLALLVTGTGGLGADDTVVSGAVSAILVPLLIWGGWAAWLSAGEFGSGTIGSSIAVVGDRLRFVLAKTIAAVLAVAVGAEIAVLAAVVAVASAAPPGHAGLGSSSVFGWVPVIAGAVAAAGVSAGFLIRGPMTSVAVVGAALLAPKGAGGLLGDLQPWVVGAGPSTVITQLAHGAQLADDQTFPAGSYAAVAVVVGVALVLLLAAALDFARRDL